MIDLVFIIHYLFRPCPILRNMDATSVRICYYPSFPV